MFLVYVQRVRVLVLYACSEGGMCRRTACLHVLYVACVYCGVYFVVCCQITGTAPRRYGCAPVAGGAAGLGNSTVALMH